MDSIPGAVISAIIIGLFGLVSVWLTSKLSRRHGQSGGVHTGGVVTEGGGHRRVWLAGRALVFLAKLSAMVMGLTALALAFGYMGDDVGIPIFVVATFGFFGAGLLGGILLILSGYDADS